MPDGQQCFLGFAPVFEQHVLPRLDVQSLLLLAATCRGLHSWLTSLPPVFWQVSKCRFLLEANSPSVFQDALAQNAACMQICQSGMSSRAAGMPILVMSGVVSNSLLFRLVQLGSALCVTHWEQLQLWGCQQACTKHVCELSCCCSRIWCCSSETMQHLRCASEQPMSRIAPIAG